MAQQKMPLKTVKLECTSNVAAESQNKLQYATGETFINVKAELTAFHKNLQLIKAKHIRDSLTALQAMHGEIKDALTHEILRNLSSINT